MPLPALLSDVEGHAYARTWGRRLWLGRRPDQRWLSRKRNWTHLC